jgi:predicted NAD/FAD-dependent oxidoreductase
VQNELGSIFDIDSKLSQADIKQEIFERIRSIASELATKRLERKSFIIGYINKKKILFMRILMLNPFFGY